MFSELLKEFKKKSRLDMLSNAQYASRVMRAHEQNELQFHLYRLFIVVALVIEQDNRILLQINLYMYGDE